MESTGHNIHQSHSFVTWAAAPLSLMVARFCIPDLMVANACIDVGSVSIEKIGHKTRWKHLTTSQSLKLLKELVKSKGLGPQGVVEMVNRALGPRVKTNGKPTCRLPIYYNMARRED